MDYIGFYSKYLALAAALVGAFMYPNYKDSKAKYFIWIIWFGFFIDALGEKYHIWFEQINNQFVYNIYTVVSITFFLWWFRSLLSSNKRRNVVKYFIFAFWAVCVIDAIQLLNVLYQPMNYAYVVGVVLLVVTICYYFIEIFNKEVVLNLKDSMYFWFALGVLLFFATFLPFFVATTFFAKTAESMLPLGIANFILNIIMNGCFIIGFFKAKRSADQHLLNEF